MNVDQEYARFKSSPTIPTHAIWHQAYEIYTVFVEEAILT